MAEPIGEISNGLPDQTKQAIAKAKKCGGGSRSRDAGLQMQLDSDTRWRLVMPLLVPCATGTISVKEIQISAAVSKLLYEVTQDASYLDDLPRTSRLFGERLSEELSLPSAHKGWDFFDLPAAVIKDSEFVQASTDHVPMGWVRVGAPNGDEDTLVVGWRGTFNDRDWALNLAVTPLESYHSQTKLHSGFSNGYAAVKRSIEAILARNGGAAQVVFTGHSLGGGIAQVCHFQHHHSRAGDGEHASVEMMRETQGYETRADALGCIKCVVFAAPPVAFFDLTKDEARRPIYPQLSDQFQNTAMNMVFGYDLVPRCLVNNEFVVAALKCRGKADLSELSPIQRLIAGAILAPSVTKRLDQFLSRPDVEELSLRAAHTSRLMWYNSYREAHSPVEDRELRVFADASDDRGLGKQNLFLTRDAFPYEDVATTMPFDDHSVLPHYIWTKWQEDTCAAAGCASVASNADDETKEMKECFDCEECQRSFCQSCWASHAPCGARPKKAGPTGHKQWLKTRKDLWRWAPTFAGEQFRLRRCSARTRQLSVISTPEDPTLLVQQYRCAAMSIKFGFDVLRPISVLYHVANYRTCMDRIFWGVAQMTEGGADQAAKWPQAWGLIKDFAKIDGMKYTRSIAGAAEGITAESAAAVFKDGASSLAKRTLQNGLVFGAAIATLESLWLLFRFWGRGDLPTGQLVVALSGAWGAALGSAFGGAAGAWIGCAAGACLGPVAAIVGAFVGGLLGGILGGCIGRWSLEELAKKMGALTLDDDNRLRYSLIVTSQMKLGLLHIDLFQLRESDVNRNFRSRAKDVHPDRFPRPAGAAACLKWEEENRARAEAFVALKKACDILLAFIEHREKYTTDYLKGYLRRLSKALFEGNHTALGDILQNQEVPAVA